MKNAAVTEKAPKPTRRPRATAKRSAPAPITLETAGSLSELIRTRLDGCSRAQRDVAQYIVDHLEESSFQTAEQLAAQVNTSSSTVVRFSQALGFEGFPELQSAARSEYRSLRNGDESSGAPGAVFDMVQTPAESSFTADFNNFNATAQRFDRDALAGVVAAITDAKQILVCGTDQAAFFASYLRHLLMLMDHRCELIASPSQDSLSRLSRIDEDTLVIAVVAGRPHTIVTRAMRLADTRGAATVSFTDASTSELAKISNHHVYFSSISDGFVRSHTALLAAIQAVVHGVYTSNAEVYGPRIRAYRGK